MVMDLAQNGDLFDVVAKAGSLSESTARHFFKQILDGLDNLHFEH
jgi:serine/threonine protein kinase